MVSRGLLLAAILMFVIFIAGLMLFVFGPDSSPFDRGDTPSLVEKGAPGVEAPDGD